MLDKMKASPFRQEIQRPVRQRGRQAVGTVLFPRQQAARMLADLAGDPQRIRHDDARQCPRAGRRGPPTGARAGCALRGRARRRRPRSGRGRHRKTKCGRKVVVDASGQSTMLQNRFKLRLWDPVLNKGAIWTYWQGAYRDTGRDEGATLVIQTTNKQGWWWYIPQHDDTISVGVVAPFDYLFKGRGSHEQIYNEEVEACPAVKQRVSMAAARPAISPPRTIPIAHRQVAGDGWVLIGDAFGFLDPLYSSGVLLALKSGELAADAIAEGLAKGDVSAAQLGKWGADVQPRRRSHAPPGVRILRWLQLRQVRPHVPASQGAGDRPVDRRPVHRPRRCGLGTDGDRCIRRRRRRSRRGPTSRRRTSRQTRSTNCIFRRAKRANRRLIGTSPGQGALF